jgi:hypothetical protein
VFVNNQTAAFPGNFFESDFELPAAIAAEAVEDVAGEAFGMDAQQRRRPVMDVAHFEDDSLLNPRFSLHAGPAFESEDPKKTVLGRKIGFGGL